MWFGTDVAACSNPVSLLPIGLTGSTGATTALQRQSSYQDGQP
jgi:hypothetical protein